jgi:AraC-like DNA-binding protein
MRYVEYPPSPRLARLVDTYWILEGDGHGIPDAILPDGRVELIVHYGAAFTRHRADGTEECQSATLLAGQALAPVVLSHHGRAGVAAIRLKPAATRSLIRVAAGEITGQILDLDTLFPSARGLRDRLGDVRDDVERVRCLESWLIAQPLADLRPDVEAAADLILRTGGRAEVGAIALLAGIHLRSLERRFTDDVGVTPKQFARIARLQRALRCIRSGAALAETALASGYYDQSHMALDFSRLASLSPGDWRDHAGVLAPLFAGSSGLRAS